MISAVIFDLDETLLDRTASLRAFLADQYWRFRNALGDVSMGAWRETFVELDARGMVHKSIVYPTLLTASQDDVRVANEMLDDYRNRCSEHAVAFEGMGETLHTLRKKGIGLGIITNGETAFQMQHVHALGLDTLVDVVLISEAEGLRKPDAALFLRGAERLNVEPASILFVGDNPSADVLGANAAGMKTAWFRCGQQWPADVAPNPGPAIEQLAEALDLVADAPSVG
jgi:putative hydrolase of the HAD superfamily